jgi:Phosphatidylinositol transfer protein
MEQQNTNSQEGVEIVEHRRFEDELLGKGRYTSKNYHLQRYIVEFFFITIDNLHY